MPASLPEKPFNQTQRMGMIASGAVAGLGARAPGRRVPGVSRFEPSNREEDVVRVLSLPVLALVPVMASDRERRQPASGIIGREPRRRCRAGRVRRDPGHLAIASARWRLTMYQRFLRPSRVALRAHAEPEVPVPDAPAPRGAEQPAVRRAARPSRSRCCSARPARARRRCCARCSNRNEYATSDGCSLNNPVLTREDFVRTLAARFELSAEAAESKAVFLDELERVLRERRTRGEITVLVVDEAQSLSERPARGNPAAREHRNVRPTSCCWSILAGQPEFAERLNDPALRQLKQRVALRCEIAAVRHCRRPPPTSPAASATAGGDAARLFTREAVMAIHEYSRGIPRTINVICDNALLGGFALGRSPSVDRRSSWT